MKFLLLSLGIFMTTFNLSYALAFAGTEGGNGGDSIGIHFKSIGNTLVFQLRNADKKKKLMIDPEKFKEILTKATIESTKADLYLNGKRKDAINYPKKMEIVVNEKSWRMLSIQDKRMLVLHEVLGLMGIDDKQYQLTMQLETMTSVETVPYFAGKDEDCLDDNHIPKAGEILDVQITNIVVISDIYSPTDRETYCTISATTADKTLHRFSASFTDRCRQLFTEKKNLYRLRVVDDHICEVLPPSN